MKIYVANSQEFIAYTAMYMLSTLLIQSYVFRHVRWPWVSDVYEYVLAVKLFWGVLSVFIDPRRPKFQITDKGQSLAEDRLSSFALPYFAIFGLVAASIGMLVYRYVNEPSMRDLIVVVGIWSGLNLLLSGIALGVVSERRERRTAPRVASERKASLKVGTTTIPVSIEDVSLGGIRVRALESVKLPPRTTATLRVEGDDRDDRMLEAPVILSWRQMTSGKSGFGLRFFGTSGDRFRIVALLGFTEVASVHTRRLKAQRSVGVLAGTAAFLTLWAVQTGRGLLFAGFRRSTPAKAGMINKTERSAA